MRTTRAMRTAVLLLGLAGLGACTHLQGVVLDARTHQAVPEATFTVGHPTGIGVFETHKVDAQGRFDFYISPTDENHLFVWDGRGDPLLSARRVNSAEMGQHMTILLQPLGE